MANTAELENVKMTIRKILNLAADDAATEGEVDNALRFASRLMEKHHLTEADLPTVDEKILELDKAEFCKQGSFAGGQRHSLWEGSAAMFTCDFVGGVQCYRGGAEIYRKNGIVQTEKNGEAAVRVQYIFYGIDEDVAIADAVFSELVLTVATLARLKYASVYRGDGLSYCMGFIAGLRTKLREDRETQKRLPQNSTALILTESRAELVARKNTLSTQWLRGNGIKLTKGVRRASPKSFNHDAYSYGQQDGRNHTVGGGRHAKIGQTRNITHA